MEHQSFRDYWTENSGKVSGWCESPRSNGFNHPHFHRVSIDVLRQAAKSCVVKREFNKARILISKAVNMARFVWVEIKEKPKLMAIIPLQLLLRWIPSEIRRLPIGLRVLPVECRCDCPECPRIRSKSRLRLFYTIRLTAISPLSARSGNQTNDLWSQKHFGGNRRRGSILRFIRPGVQLGEIYECKEAHLQVHRHPAGAPPNWSSPTVVSETCKGTDFGGNCHR